jgi:hypothetical protein
MPPKRVQWDCPWSEDNIPAILSCNICNVYSTSSWKKMLKHMRDQHRLPDRALQNTFLWEQAAKRESVPWMTWEEYSAVEPREGDRFYCKLCNTKERSVVSAFYHLNTVHQFAGNVLGKWLITVDGNAVRNHTVTRVFKESYDTYEQWLAHSFYEGDDDEDGTDESVDNENQCKNEPRRPTRAGDQDSDPECTASETPSSSYDPCERGEVLQPRFVVRTAGFVKCSTGWPSTSTGCCATIDRGACNLGTQSGPVVEAARARVRFHPGACYSILPRVGAQGERQTQKEGLVSHLEKTPELLAIPP